jgi:hypothetical protein
MFKKLVGLSSLLLKNIPKAAGHRQTEGCFRTIEDFLIKQVLEKAALEGN